MNTDEFLRDLRGKQPAQQVEAIDGALWGQSVDPIWPDEDIAKLKAARLEALKRMGGTRHATRHKGNARRA